MKIITWNINGYRTITGQNSSRRYNVVTKENKLFAYISEANPDIICLQETKADRSQIDEENLFPENYSGEYFSATSRKGYSGVVTFAKTPPTSYSFGFDEERFDREGRVIISHYPDFVLLNIYFPNGTSGDERVEYKLEFYDKLFEFLGDLRKTQSNIIICGDYNTAHNEIDLARPKENQNNSGFLEIERVKLDELIELGFSDVFRERNPELVQYSWWSNRGRARENNVGWRIDYFFVSNNLMPKVKDCFYEMEVQGSDHCPLVLDIDI